MLAPRDPREGQVWKSIFRPGSIYRPGYRDTSRDRALATMNNVLYHLHPVKLKRHGLKLTYTYCLGGLSFLLFILLTVTGIYLMFFYRPSAGFGQELAYKDIQALSSGVSFGQLVRNLHRWSAHAMVFTVFLHMARVFYHGAYKAPREFNWVVGVILLLLTLLLSFTGYLLPWDQLAIWAVTVGTNMARAHPVIGHEGPGAELLKIGDISFVTVGSDIRFALLSGRFVGEATLLRFYVLHCVAIPFVAIILMAIHFWRVRKDGGISGPM